jgi:hypothetical protein
MAERILKDDLGLACYEESTGKWAGCLLSEDNFTLSTFFSSFIYDGVNDFGIDLCSYLMKEGMGKIGVTVSKKRYEHIHMAHIGVDSDNWGHNILKNFMKFFYSQHPIAKNAKVILFECTYSIPLRDSRELE